MGDTLMPGVLLVNGIESDNEDLEFDCIGAGKTIKFKRDGVEVASIGDAGFPVYGIGYGQTWVDETANRVAGTTYTNTTGGPIMVACSGLNSGPTSITTLSSYVDGIRLNYTGMGDNRRTSLVFIVPNGSTYSVGNTTGLAFVDWVELK